MTTHFCLRNPCPVCEPWVKPWWHNHWVYPYKHVERGWECPRCGRIISPDVRECSNCNRKPRRVQKQLDWHRKLDW